jgi:hypothetical protein
MTMVITYSLYLAISIVLTVWVARTLSKNGRIFLVDSFGGNEALADSVNHCWWSASISSMSAM